MKGLKRLIFVLRRLHKAYYLLHREEAWGNALRPLLAIECAKYSREECLKL